MKDLGLRQKLIGSIALFMAVLALFFFLYNPWRYKKAADDSLSDRAADMAAALSGGLTRAVAERDVARMEDVLYGFAKLAGQEDGLLYTNVTFSDGLSVSWVAPGFPAERAVAVALLAEDTRVTVRHQDGHAHVHMPILVGDVAAGAARTGATLNLGLSRHRVVAAFVRSRWEAGIFGGALVLMGILVAQLLGRSLMQPILGTARELENVSRGLENAARDQEASSAEEAAAVAQTRRSMATLLDSAQKIADYSSNVLGNAEQSAERSHMIAESIGNLNIWAERVADLLGSIMQVADRADLLALNASLEGTRAGEAGKGFALVGAEMRRLAENVIESVSGIRELLKEIRDASQETAAASKEGKLSSTAMRQSAQKIALLTQDQRKATEQVMASMDELGNILNLTLDGIQRTSASAGQLTQLAADLLRVVQPQRQDAGAPTAESGNNAAA